MMRSGSIRLRTLFAIMRLVLFREIDLIIDRVVIVPIILPVDVVFDTKEHGLRFQISLVFELDVESETIAFVRCLFLSHVGIVFCYHLGSSLPVIEGESYDNQFVEGQVAYCHSSNENLGICG